MNGFDVRMLGGIFIAEVIVVFVAVKLCQRLDDRTDQLETLIHTRSPAEPYDASANR